MGTEYIHRTQFTMNKPALLRWPIRLILNDKFILLWIVINTLVVFVQESGVDSMLLNILDALCTTLFVVEMIVKISHYGIKNYIKNWWNLMDGVVTIMAIPSLLLFFIPASYGNLSVFLVLRSLRLLKLLRTGRYFPNIQQIIEGFKLALRRSYAILLGYAVLLILLSIINCCLFRASAPDYFSTPLESVYSVFRVFSVEGWYEIPNAITQNMAPIWTHIVRIYFCILLLGGGIVGLSLLNSVFVDAMVSDNNDDIKKQLDNIEEKINEIMSNQQVMNK